MTMNLSQSIAALPMPSHPEDSVTFITVSDPVEHADGLKKYISYRVDVRPPPSHDPTAPPPGISSVLRRYSDFLWLWEKLHVERAGAIVPPLPEKQPVGRFQTAFVEDRRKHLERFLRRLWVHPELQDTPSLETFLRADDYQFQAAKNAKGVVIPQNNMSQQPFSYAPYPNAMGGSVNPPKKDGIKRWFAEAKTSISGDLIRSPDDELFDEISRYVNALDNQMRNVAHQATGLVRKGKDLANGLFEFGFAFNQLGQSEADSLGDALKRMGETADRLSVLSADHAEQEMLSFEEPLQDYIKMIHSVKLALQRRHEKRLTYSTAMSEVEAKRTALAKLRMQIGAEAKAYSTEMSLRRTEEAAEVARQDFAQVSQRVLREVDRFKMIKAEEMRQTVLEYIQLQVDYNKRMEEAWAALLPQLEHVQLDAQYKPSLQQQHHQQQLEQQQMHMNVSPPVIMSSDDPSGLSIQYREAPPHGL